MANVNVSRQVLKTSRLRLKEALLIDFVPGGGHKVKTKYQILAHKLTPKLSLNPTSYNINIKDINTSVPLKMGRY